MTLERDESLILQEMHYYLVPHANESFFAVEGGLIKAYSAWISGH
jgi:hypothetical protein